MEVRHGGTKKRRIIMLIAPSMLSCDFSKMGAETEKMDKAGADWIHLDVMDGHFVPNITFGAPVIKWIRPFTKLPFDVHLMISDPLKYVDDFADAGADYIVFHVECESDIEKTIDKIHSKNIKAGLAVKPKTPAEAIFPYLHKIELALVMTVEPGFGGQSYMAENIEKIAKIKAEAKRLGKDILCQVDGGINDKTIAHAYQGGADVCVAGTAVFKAEDSRKAIDNLKELCK